MSRSGELDEPRRGTRVRKQVQHFDPSEKKQQKKKRVAHNSDSESSDGSSEEEAQGPSKRKANGARKPPAPKRRKAGAGKVAPLGVIPEGIEGYKTDSPLFNALLQPNVAFEPLVSAWVDAYQAATGDEEAEKTAVHELVVFFIRACGLGADVEDPEALDQDGVADVIERIQDESVRTNAASYPLTTRSKGLKCFKPNLVSLVSNLVETLSLTPYLFDDVDSTKHSVPLMPLLFTWLHSMSSSPLRPIRHMGTFIALQVTSALCRVAATITKELGIKQRQKEAEIKKAGTTAAGKRRVAEAENAVKEIHERKTRIEEYMQETETVLFVHRVRDSDPAIRTDCIKELGVWVKEFPEMYLKGQFFSHFTRSTNDSDGPVRLETMKALVHVFSKASAANDTSSFTLRIAPRLIQMAAQDTETAVRTNAIAVITQIDKTGALEDDDEVQRDQVARLIFDVDPKVRKAAAAFVKNIWEERAESLVTDFGARRDGKKKRAAKIKEEELQRRFEWKALAQLLVETSKELASPEDDDAGPSKALDLVAAETALTTRAAAASEALYAQIELLQDWHALVDYLLLDHSTSENDPWLLTEEEEDFMLEVLITCIRKEEEDEEDYPKSKALMKVLPRLFTKHQTEASRIVGILSITKYMNLSLYLDMRQTAAYETLWDDVTKQFLQHTDPNVLTAAIHAISTLTANTPMEATNKEKLAELEESLFTSLRDVIDGQDVSVMTIGEDQLASIEAVLLRVKLLSSSRDIVGVMQDEEGGQSSGWAIVLAFAERGGLGFKEEYQIVEYALYIAMVHIAWLVRRFTDADADVPEKVATLKARRDEALEVFAAFSVRGASNATDEVKRQAFLAYIHIHNLFSGRGEQPSPAARVAPLEMSFDKQNKLGGVFQVAAERYASDVDEGARDEDEDDDMTRAEKTRAVVFFRLVAAFVAAIRIGTIDVDQAKEPLAYVGRFGPTYDAIVKKLVDVLRDEGIYNNEATTVAAVVQDALQNSFGQFLERDTEPEPDAPIALARLASQAFIVPGLHFTVLKQIHPTDVYDMHMAAIDWLFKKLAGVAKQHASAKDKEVRARAAAKRSRLLLFFKPLGLLLGPVTPRDAARLRNHVESRIDEAKVEAARNTASYRAYDKRLLGIALKDKDAQVKVRTQGQGQEKKGKSAEMIEDSDVEDEPENEATPPADDAADDAEADEAEVAEDENAHTPTNGRSKRTHPDDDELPDLSLGDLGDIGDEIDLAFSPPQADRERSVSVAPDAKRRKTIRKF